MKKIVFILLIPFLSCTQDSKEAEKPLGEHLAKLHCQGCHSFPKAADLDKNTWANYVLPRMGYMLGIGRNDSVDQILFETGKAGEKVRNLDLFPEERKLSDEEWESIQEYFISQSPQELAKPVYAELDSSLTDFDLLIPQLKLSPPSTTLIQFSPTGGIYAGDANTKSLIKLDKRLNVQQAARLKEGLVDLIEEPEALYLTLMGSFSPTDADTGFFMALPQVENAQAQIVLPALGRPVDAEIADLDQDGIEDILLSEFGKWTGELAWWKNRGVEGMQKMMLREKAGATQTQILDMNEDELPDILALFGQGEEGIFLYENQDNGKFQEKQLLRFPPSYGSSHMEILDWDQDGDMDILYCAGDNADYPPIIKPYHGIYLYLNNGQNNFEQSWFYALPGAYGTRTRDYDQDGDLDIAAISFFPDYLGDDTRSFVFLRNEGKEFSSQTISDLDRLGRWIVMDAGDFDLDGDEDIALGSLSFEVLVIS
ncbi:MAG: VCBS repeat-containing protein [Bacteroidota bacterium]